MSALVLTTIIDWVLKIFLAIGGITGLLSLFLVREQKRKLLSDTGKTDAEADSIVADAKIKHTDRESRVLDMYEKVLKTTTDRLDDANKRLDELTMYVNVLVLALRNAGQPVPPMPKTMADRAYHEENEDAGEAPN